MNIESFTNELKIDFWSAIAECGNPYLLKIMKNNKGTIDNILERDYLDTLLKVQAWAEDVRLGKADGRIVDFAKASGIPVQRVYFTLKFLDIPIKDEEKYEHVEYVVSYDKLAEKYKTI